MKICFTKKQKGQKKKKVSNSESRNPVPSVSTGAQIT